jgi:hypothetical protein
MLGIAWSEISNVWKIYESRGIELEDHLVPCTGGTSIRSWSSQVRRAPKAAGLVMSLEI